MKNILKIIPEAYRKPKLLGLITLGFASGLPLALIGSTLSIWLKENGIDKSSIGMLSLCGLFFSFKFVWSPFMDSIKLPFLGRLGRRTSWILLSQTLLILSIILLGLTNPITSMTNIVFFTCLVAFCSASHDIVVDAFRIESLEENEQAAGSSIAVLGYRIGMLFTTSGALFLSEKFTWSQVYFFSSMGVLAGTASLLLMGEPKKNAVEVSPNSENESYFRRVIIEPFSEFAQRKNWLIILLFIVCFKLGEAFLGSMLSIFYIELGFSKSEIAAIVKTFGLFATIGGSIVGGSLLYKFSMTKSLWISGIFQMLSNLIFIAQKYAGHDPKFLVFSIFLENSTGGVATAVMIGYIGSLCNLRYTATQFALFSSLSAVGRTGFAAFSGFIANKLGWEYYFLFTSLICIPSLLMIPFLKTTPKIENKLVESL